MFIWPVTFLPFYFMFLSFLNGDTPYTTRNPAFGQLLLDIWVRMHVQNVLLHDTFMRTMMFFSQFVLDCFDIFLPFVCCSIRNIHKKPFWSKKSSLSPPQKKTYFHFHPAHSNKCVSSKSMTSRNLSTDRLLQLFKATQMQVISPNCCGAKVATQNTKRTRVCYAKNHHIITTIIKKWRHWWCIEHRPQHMEVHNGSQW